MFAVTDTGFVVQFANGYEISVQFGPGNYCANRTLSFNAFRAAADRRSATAEIAAFKIGTNIAVPIDGFEANEGNVYGWTTPEAFAQMVERVAAMTPVEPVEEVE